MDIFQHPLPRPNPIAIGALSAALALAAMLCAPVLDDKVSLTADFTSAWAPGRYANASGSVRLEGRRSAWDRLSAPLDEKRARAALGAALSASLAEAGPRLATGAIDQRAWAQKTLARCSASLASSLGGSWTARSADLAAAATLDAPTPPAGGL